MGNHDFSTDELHALAAGWGALEALPGGLPAVAPFALELLPVALRPWIADIAERMQCPSDYPAVAAMVGLAAVVGRQLGIRPKAYDDWTVVPNLWGCVVGRPALLKTPALQEPLRMIGALEARAREEHEDVQKACAAQKLIHEAMDKDTRSRLGKAVKSQDNALAQALAAEIVETPQAPARRRYLTQDATIEKLGELLRDNPRGVLIYRDELVGFLRSMDQEGREGSRAFFLEAWNGSGSYTFDRIGRGTVELEAACVSIIGAIQPGPLRDYMLGAIVGGAGDDGMVQRFQLAVWPDAGREWVNVDRWPNTEARQAARAIFQRLDTLDPLAIGAQQADDDPMPWLRFDHPAQTIFNDWRERLETRLRQDDLHPAMESHLAKFRSLVPSLALLCHLADNAEGGAVDTAALLRALSWAEYLESHAGRIYAPAMSPELFVALELAKRLPSLPEPFKAKDVYRRHWRGLDMEGTRSAIQVLTDFGHIREVAEDATGYGPANGTLRGPSLPAEDPGMSYLERLRLAEKNGERPPPPSVESAETPLKATFGTLDTSPPRPFLGFFPRCGPGASPQRPGPGGHPRGHRRARCDSRIRRRGVPSPGRTPGPRGDAGVPSPRRHGPRPTSPVGHPARPRLRTGGGHPRRPRSLRRPSACSRSASAPFPPPAPSPWLPNP